MKSLARLLLIGVLAGATAAVSAQELFVYRNIDTQTGQYLNGGSANQSGNIITRLVADDLTPLSGFAGQNIVNIYFSVVNNNATAVSARPRLRMWSGDGTGGAPGTLLAAFSFNPISFGANSASSFFFNPGVLALPSGTFWMGLTFDNNTGGTGATLAQMDNLGMALFNPPTIGTSADHYFQTTAAGAFNVNNPAGTMLDFGGNPPANFFFGVSVPEPGTCALFGLAAAACVIFRRRK